MRRCNAGRLIFSIGDAADSIMYVLKGTVKVSVKSQAGREAIVAIVRAGDFLGEACLAVNRRVRVLQPRLRQASLW